MKNYLLLPHKYKLFGWILFLTGLAAFTFCYIVYNNLGEGHANLELPFLGWNYSSNGLLISENVQKELFTSAVILGLLIISFSREKREDEYINLLRLQSFQWAILISYGILFVANWVIYGMNFFNFMTYNLLTVLIVFIIKFHVSLFLLNKRELADEK